MKGRESAENYLKAILVLQKKLGEVRSVDIANELNVSKPSVSIAVKKLRNEGLVTLNERNHLVLTEDGLKYATSVFERHMVIEMFLINVLNIDEKTAHSDACCFEHLVSTETFNKMLDYYDKSRGCCKT